ncbi:hypothetical protein V6N13_114251 [Hibiscus sabdariffa]
MIMQSNKSRIRNLSIRNAPNPTGSLLFSIAHLRHPTTCIQEPYKAIAALRDSPAGAPSSIELTGATTDTWPDFTYDEDVIGSLKEVLPVREFELY